MATYVGQDADRTQPRPASDVPPRAGTTLPLAATLAIGAITRFLFLGRKSFWLDEGASVALARLPWHAFLERLSTHEANMAVYYLLLRGWLHFGQSEFWIRTLSVIPGVATLPVVYAVGRRLFDRRVGLAAALLLSVHVGHVAYSQEARGYSLAVLFVSLSCLYFLRVVQSCQSGDVVLYVLFTVLAVYTHFFAALVVAAQVVSLALLRWHDLPTRRLVRGLGLVVILCVPAVLFAFSKDVGQLNWVRKTSLKELEHAATLLTGNGVVLLAYVVLWVIATAAAITTWRKHGRSMDSWSYGFLLSWLFTPLLLMLLISIKKPILAPRFLLTSVPAAVLLAAIGVLRLRPFYLRIAALTLLVAVSAAALAGYYRKPKEDWRGVTQYVLTHARPDDLVLIYPQWDGVAVDYYRSFSAKSAEPSFEEIPPDKPASVANLAPHPRLWLIIYAWRFTHDPAADRIRNILSRTYTETGEQRFGDIDILRYDAASR
jgi:mannosyltransferase